VATASVATASMDSMASMATASDDASDSISDDGSGSTRCPQGRAMTEQPCDAWGGSRWALRRCLHQDWRERATAKELLAGASSWLAAR
jgi:hypothetical protein